MLRKALAFFLVVSWISLAGLDVLEDLEPSLEAEVHSSADTPLRAIGLPYQFVNNIIESADSSRARHSPTFGRPAIRLVLQAPAFSRKPSRLHKFNSVFLI
jgi:hypothetical protein